MMPERRKELKSESDKLNTQKNIIQQASFRRYIEQTWQEHVLRCYQILWKQYLAFVYKLVERL